LEGAKLRRSGRRQTRYYNNASNARGAEILENEAALSHEMTGLIVRPGAKEILLMKAVKVRREVGPGRGQEEVCLRRGRSMERMTIKL
jgi:hypothetical protein